MINTINMGDSWVTHAITDSACYKYSCLAGYFIFLITISSRYWNYKTRIARIRSSTYSKKPQRTTCKASWKNRWLFDLGGRRTTLVYQNWFFDFSENHAWLFIRNWFFKCWEAWLWTLRTNLITIMGLFLRLITA
jgi:hypothetical protein